MNVLAIIPARGGSKGILDKNIQKLGKKPLIEYSISSAKKSKKINKILVSTDSQKIVKIVESLGINVPFLRPKRISKDSSQLLDVIKHGLNYLKNENYVPEIICLLQPTSPFRSYDLIDKSIQMLKSSNATSVVSVSKIKTHPDTLFSLKSDYLKPLNPNFEKFSNRQKRKILYYPTGSIYTFWSRNISKFNSIYGPKIKLIETEEKFNVDIDYLFDLFIGEMILKNWEKYKKNH